MTSEDQGREPERTVSGRHARVESEHVDVGSAHIDVSEATIIQSSQSRLQARYLAWSLCVLFVVMIAIGGANLLFTSNQVHQVRAVAAQAQQNRATVVQLCETGNEFRAQQVTLWTHLIEISQPPPHETAVQKRQRQVLITGFLAYVHKVFAPRNCEALPPAR